MFLDVSRLYGNTELQEIGNRYRPNLVGMWEEDFLSQLTSEERLPAGNVTLKLPLLGVARYPLEFYSNPPTQEVFLPIASVKFIDDLAVAYAYYEKMRCDLGTVSDYAAALRFQPQNAGGSPLDALGVPREALKDRYVDDVAQKILKSIVYFVAAHEYGHVMYRHGGYGAMTAELAQLQEVQADTFALRIMARIGVAPLALTFFFLIASRLEATPGDFPSLVDYERYLRQQATHPVSSLRIFRVAEGIEGHTNAFARLQADRASWEKRLQREAQELREIASTLDDRKMRQFLAERAKTADFATFRNACRH